MTVSKVLRDAPDVSQATKTKIRSLAEEMRYVPDALAQGLRTRKTRLLGLVGPCVTHPVFSQAILAIEDQCQALGYDLLLAQTNEDPQREETALRRLLARRVDGVFLYPVYRLAPHAPIYAELEKSGTFTVLLGHRAPFCHQFVNVETDDAGTSYQITRHLLDLGHVQIAFFAGPPAAPWAQERFDGYRRALNDTGIAAEDRLIFTAGSTLQDGRTAAVQFINEATAATAIQAAADPVALGAALELAEHGLRIPEDLSMAGFGDEPGAEHFRVPLTTARLPGFELGLAAADCMLRALQGEKPDSRRLATELVLRSSTARRPHLPHSHRPVPTTVP